MAAARCGWCRTSSVAVHQQVRPLGQCDDQQRGAADVEPGVGVADLRGQQHPRLRGQTTAARESPGKGGCRGAVAAARPHSAARSRRVDRSTTPPRRRAPRPRRCRDVPRTPSDSWISSASVIGSEPACATRPLTAARPPTTAAADEPSPRECGMSLRQRTFRPVAADPGGAQATLDRPHHEVRRVQRNLSGAFTLDLDGETGFGCLDDDFVVEAQRQAQTVEARARGWRWRPRRQLVAVSPAGRICVTDDLRQTSPSSATTATGSTGNRRDGRHALAARCRGP